MADEEKIVNEADNSPADEGDVILTDAEGNDYRFIFLDYVEYQEKLYAVFAPADADLDNEDEELSVFVMEVVMVNENVSFNLIEDDKIAEGVIAAFYEGAEAEEVSED